MNYSAGNNEWFSLRFLPCLYTILLLILFTKTLSAQTFNVNTTIDTIDSNPGDGICADSNGTCSLRAAIHESNILPGQDDIFLTAATYQLSLPDILMWGTTVTTGDLNITDDVSITGKSADATIIDGGNVSRIFEIRNSIIVTISNLTIQNGNVDSIYNFFGQNSGGGIYIQNNSTVTLKDCNITDNKANTGGGIYAGALFWSGTYTTSTVNINNCQITNNTSNIFGGGVSIANYDGEIYITDSTIADNTSDSGGGLSQNTNSRVIITGVTFSGNQAENGAGIFTGYGRHKLHIKNSTISGNEARLSGGGVYLEDNIANPDLLFSNTNITNNKLNTYTSSGGIYNTNTSLLVANTIIASNYNGNGVNSDCSGVITSKGYNLIGINTGCLISSSNGDIIGESGNPLNPQITALADNGGATLTHALLPTSIAINNGNPAIPGSGGFACELEDQRGVNRANLNECDIGAYESTGIADIWVSLNNSANTVYEGETVTQIVRTGNNSGNTAFGPSLVINMPEESHLVNLINSNWDCVTDNIILKCTKTVINPFEQDEISIQFQPSINVVNLLTSASIDAITTDTNLQNNLAQLVVLINDDDSYGSNAGEDGESIDSSAVKDDINQNNKPDDTVNDVKPYDSLLDRIRWELTWMRDKEQETTEEKVTKKDLFITDISDNWGSYSSLEYDDKWINEERIIFNEYGLDKNIFVVTTGTIIIGGFIHIYLRALSLLGMFFSSPLLIRFNPAPLVMISSAEKSRRNRAIQKELELENMNKNIKKIFDDKL